MKKISYPTIKTETQEEKQDQFLCLSCNFKNVCLTFSQYFIMMNIMKINPVYIPVLDFCSDYSADKVKVDKIPDDLNERTISIQMLLSSQS